ncbi:MAG: nucleoside-diphosphate kinase [Planctomycetes bacterium GWF2_50_10]|nr:MAG: nucleoside-diphosphate kinase [Planctomycetes bacterium GWF2_50_10]
MERTLIILKPDAVARRLTGEILTRFEKKGLKLIAAKFMTISKELAEKHYDVHKGKPFFESVVGYLSSGPSMVIVLESANVISMTRKMMGATFGYTAEPGTIRGDFGCSRGYNLVHGSDSPESAAYEIPLYFKPEELVEWEFSDSGWLYGRD